MELIYPGPFDQVDLVLEDRVVQTSRDQPVEIPDRYAAGLEAQGWTRVKPKPRTRREPKTADPEKEQ